MGTVGRSITMQVPVPESEKSLDHSLNELESTLLNFSARAIRDSAAREKYNALVFKAIKGIRTETSQGRISIQRGAQKAVAARNELIFQMRRRSSDIGNEVAKFLKGNELTLDGLAEKYSKELFRKEFQSLTSPRDKERVLLRILKGAGATNSSVSRVATLLGRVGGVLSIVTLGVSVYEVCESNDRVRTAGKATSSFLLGYSGSVVGGWAGLACGPASFVCVPLGVLIGGALSAAGNEFLWEWEKAS